MSAADTPDDVAKPESSHGFSSWYGKGGASSGSWAIPTLVAVVAILVYLNSIANGFAFDDVLVIVENPTVHDLTNQLRIWLTPYWPGPDARTRGLYRPLTIFLFAVQWSVGGGSPFLFHLLNVLLHAVASVLVFHLVDRLAGWRGAFGAALLFAVHPVHVEAVSNVVGQAELLSACLMLTAAVLYLGRPMEGEVTGRHRRLIGGFFLMGLLAKENAIVLPALLLFLDVAQGRVRRVGYLHSVGRICVLLVGVTSVYLVMRGFILGGGVAGDAAFNIQFLRDPSTRVLTALSVWTHYARLLVAPLHLSAMYDPATIPPVEAVNPSVVGGSAILLFLLLTAGLRRAWPAMGLGAAWFLTTIFLVSNLILPIGTVLGERTLYVPSVAMAIWVGFGLEWFLDRETPHRLLRPVGLGAFGIVLIAFGIRAAARNPVWSDNETLFETTFRDHPENFRAQWFRAQRMVEEGDSTGSVRHWRRALEIYPGHTDFLTDYARFLLATGELQEADKMVSQALQLRPDAPNGLFVQGLVDNALGRESRARERANSLAELGFSEMASQLIDSLTAPPRINR